MYFSTKLKKNHISLPIFPLVLIFALQIEHFEDTCLYALNIKKLRRD